MKLISAMIARFPDGLEYADAVQLCLCLHVRANRFPSDVFGGAGERNELARSFAEFAKVGRIYPGTDSVIKPAELLHEGFWLGILSSIYSEVKLIEDHTPEQFQDIFL